MRAAMAGYSTQGTTTEVMAGPKVSVDYQRAKTDNLWLDFSLGLMSGMCLSRNDEKDCVLVSGHSVESLIGIKAQSRSTTGWVLYGRVLGGAVVVVPQQWPTGAAVLFRAGGGIKYFSSSTVALGLDVAGDLGVGKFQLGYQSTEHVIIGLDVGATVDFRF